MTNTEEKHSCGMAIYRAAQGLLHYEAALQQILKSKDLAKIHEIADQALVKG